VTHYENREPIPASGNARIAHRVRAQEKAR
jgi:hypothetical protein